MVLLSGVSGNGTADGRGDAEFLGPVRAGDLRGKPLQGVWAARLAPRLAGRAA